MCKLLEDEQVLGVLVEEVYCESEPVLEEAEVHTDIHCGRTLPLEVAVLELLRSHNRDNVASNSVFVRSVEVKGEEVGDAVVTHSTPTCAELEVGYVTCVLHEFLLVDSPGCGEGREESPFVLLGEYRGTVGTYGTCDKVAVVEIVVCTGEEGEQRVAAGIGLH